MSRIGNKEIVLPQGVELAVAEGNNVTVKGPKGELNFKFNEALTINVEANKVIIARPNDTKESKMIHGTTRAVLNNMVVGVSEGFVKEIQIIGVGYRASVKGNILDIAAGYSHPIEMEIPEGLTVETSTDKKTKEMFIKISGCDKQLVGQFAAEIREVRKPEPYLGKGFRYRNENVRRKDGKTAKK